MELDKYLTEATAEETSKKNILKWTAVMAKDLKKIDVLVKSGDWDKLESIYKDIQFNTRRLDTYIGVLSRSRK